MRAAKWMLSGALALFMVTCTITSAMAQVNIIGTWNVEVVGYCGKKGSYQYVTELITTIITGQTDEAFYGYWLAEGSIKKHYFNGIIQSTLHPGYNRIVMTEDKGGVIMEGTLGTDEITITGFRSEQPGYRSKKVYCTYTFTATKQGPTEKSNIENPK